MTQTISVLQAAPEQRGVAGGGTDPARVIDDPCTGELAVQAPPGTQSTTFFIESATGIFTGNPGPNLTGPFDIDEDGRLFKTAITSITETDVTFERFGKASFGNVAEAGLSQTFLLDDMLVAGTFDGGGGFGIDTSVSLSQMDLVIAADFDLDVDVDGDDFLIWQVGFGVNDAGDADFDGDTDGDDFLVWQRNFGYTSSRIRQSAIPEPTSLLLFLVGSITYLGRASVWSAVNHRRFPSRRGRFRRAPLVAASAEAGPTAKAVGTRGATPGVHGQVSRSP